MDEILRIGKALCSKTRLRLVSILLGSKLTVNETMRNYNKRFGNTKYRTSIYRHLEKLVECGVLTKEYDQKDKTFKYGVAMSTLILDLQAMACRNARQMAVTENGC